MRKKAAFMGVLLLFVMSFFMTSVGEYQQETVIVELYSAPLLENERSLFAAVEQEIKLEQAQFVEAAKKELEREIVPLYSYTHIANGVALLLYPHEIEQLQENESVKAIYQEKYFEEMHVTSSAQGMCGVDAGWSSGYEGEGMVVAVIDSECDTDHSMFVLSNEEAAAISYEEMKARLYFLDLNAKQLTSALSVSQVYKSSKIPFAYNYGKGTTDCSNSNSTHGTHVTGIVAANNSSGYSAGVDGIAPEAQVLSLCCMTESGGLAQSTILAAMEDAVLLGADVINLSMGISGGIAGDSFFASAVERIENAGIVFSCAIGNDGKAPSKNSYGTRIIPASYTDYGTVSSPATVKNAIGVGAAGTALTIQDAGVAYYSSWGAASDLTIKPDILAPGSNIYSTQSGDSYTTLTGTSMATPFFSGSSLLVIEQLKEKYPDLSKKERMKLSQNILMSSAEKLTADGCYVSPRGQGAGLVNVKAALSLPVVLFSKDDTGKIELGDGLDNSFTLTFYAKNLSDTEQSVTLKGCVLNDEVSYSSENQMFSVTNTAYFPEANMLHGDKEVNLNNIAYTGSTVTLSAGETKEITVTVTLDEIILMQKEMLLPNGMFIEGFVWLENETFSAGIPYLGYIGDWTKATMFDRFKYDEGRGYFGDSYLLYPYQGGYYIMGEGIYEQTTLGDADKNAISPNGDGSGDSLGIKLILLRGAKTLTFTIKNEVGETVAEKGKQSIEKTVSKDVCFTELIFDGKCNEQTVPDGQYYLTVCGEKDYEGAYTLEEKTIPFAVDTVAPELISVTTVKRDSGDYLKICARDNHYLQLAQLSEEIYAQTENPVKGEESTVYLPMQTMNNGEAVTITLLDYALNKTTFTVTPAMGYSACYKDGRLVACIQYRAVLMDGALQNRPTQDGVSYDTQRDFLWESPLTPLQ